MSIVVVLVAQSCPTLCDPMDGSPPGSSVHGILQAGILEWVAISSSRRPSRPRDWTWVFVISGRFFTMWATREAPIMSVGKVDFSCSVTCNSLWPHGLSPPVSSVHGILQTRILDWVDIPLGSHSLLQGISLTQGSNTCLPHCRQRLYPLNHRGSPHCVCARVMSLCATPWTVAHQAPLSMGFSRQGYWSGLPCLPPGHLPNPGIQPTSLISPALAGISAYSLPLLLPGKPHILSIVYFYFSCKTNLGSLCFLSFFSPIIA